MTKITLYGLKACDTCRKAKKALEGAAADLDFVDVREAGVPEAVAVRASDLFGETLVNKRSTTWREMSETDRALPIPEMFAAHPTVMKRPLLLRGAEMYLGWTNDVQKQLLG